MKMQTKPAFKLRIRKDRLEFLGYIMRKEVLKNLILIAYTEVKMGRKKLPT